MKIVRCFRYAYGRKIVVLAFLSLITFFLLSQFTLSASKLRLIHGSLIERNFNKLPGSFGTKMNNWLSKNILRFKYEDIHCKRRYNESNSEIILQWIKPLSRELKIKDGESLFDSNIGCLKWLKHFRTEYPGLALAGYDENDDAVNYAKRVFNDTKGYFVKRLSETKSCSFDHAINFGGLQTMRADKQCSKVKAILNRVKHGGSLYIGHNLERSCNSSNCVKCLSDMEAIGFVVLDKCFWSKICLRDEEDIADIYYIPEQKLYNSVQYFSACQTGVFIHKKVFNSTSRGTVVHNEGKIFSTQKHSNMYRC